LKDCVTLQKYLASSPEGGKGSHRIYVLRGVGELLNFQNVDGKAKPYQVKQFINIIEKYRILESAHA